MKRTLARLTNIFVSLSMLGMLVTVSAPQPVSALEVIEVVLLPSTSTVNVGDTFDITIECHSGAQQIDTYAVFLDFDPAKLAVTAKVTPGPYFDTKYQSAFDNVAGTCDATYAQMEGP